MPGRIMGVAITAAGHTAGIVEEKEKTAWTF